MDTSIDTQLVKDTIVVKTAEAVYLYAQATRRVAKVRNFNLDVQSELAGKGFFNSIPRSMRYRRPRKWMNLMLLMGRDCPLACLYCYDSNSGCSNAMMTPETADMAIAVYLAAKPRKPKVTFFAGGEPTLNVAAIKHVVMKYGDTVKWQLTTSGVLSLAWLRWLLDHRVGITVSVDGPPHIQDILRPLRSGGKSSPIVERTIRELVTRGRAVGVRATITKETLQELGDILNYFDSLEVDPIHLEGLYPLGRAMEEQRVILTPLTSDDQTKMLLTGLAWAQANGRRLKMGSLSYLLRPKVAGYCGAMQMQTMVVNHLGQLTACSEVVDDSANEWSVFNVGHIDVDGKLRVVDEKLRVLQRRVVTNMPACRKCFAKYLCRGGCPHKALIATGSMYEQDVRHCEFMREIIPILIQRMVEPVDAIKDEEV